MLASAAVFLFGLGLCMIGFAVPTMDDVGIVVMIIGMVGFGVRAFEVARWIVKD